MTHRLAKRFLGFFRRSVRPSLCADCKVKMDRKFGLAGKIKHRIKHRRKGRKSHRKSHSRHKLRPGVHSVKIRGKMRKVRVLPNGRWRFMKA